MSISTQCLECKHYTGFCTCEAFPEKIPQEIFDGTFDHINEYPNDNGIRFEPRNLTEISKAEKTISVKATPKRKGHKRRITFEGKKPEIKEPVIDYKDLSTKILEHESNIKSQPGGEKIIETVEEYTAAEYMFINEYIKTGIILPFPSGMKFKESKIKEKIDTIETFIKDAPKHKGIVYRGMKFSKEGKEPIQQFNKFVNEMEIASEYTIKQFTSSSISKDTAMNFSMDKENYGVLFKIKSKNGVYLNGLSLMPEEKEVLFNKETKFKILGIDRSNPQNVQITMEEI